MKKFGTLLVSAVILFAVKSVVRGSRGFEKPDCDVVNQSCLEVVARKLDRDLPKKIDDDTQWVKATAGSRQMGFTYRLTKIDRSQISARDLIDAVKFEPQHRLCSDTKFRDHLPSQGDLGPPRLRR